MAKTVTNVFAESRAPILDAPQYLFVSRQAANTFPQLMESAVILSYHSYLPGPISHGWRRTARISDLFSIEFWSSITLTSVGMVFMKQFGALSPTLQKIIIHAVQPGIGSAFALFLSLLVKYPVSFSGILVVGLIVYFINKKLCRQTNADEDNISNPEKETHRSMNMSLDKTERDEADDNESDSDSESNDLEVIKLSGALSDEIRAPTTPILWDLDEDGDSLHPRDIEDTYLSDTTSDSDEIRCTTTVSTYPEHVLKSESCLANYSRSLSSESPVQEDVCNSKQDTEVCPMSDLLVIDIGKGSRPDRVAEQCEIFSIDRQDWNVPDDAYDLPSLIDDDFNV